MSENIINTDFNCQLSEDNERIRKDLSECHKRIEFLESYRKFFIKFSESCVCGQSSFTKCLVKSLESHYSKTFLKSGASDGQVIGELFLQSEPSNDKNSNNDCFQQTDQQIGDNNNQNNDNIVLVFNKSNNSIVKKNRDNVDTNNEIVINKLVVKKPEVSVHQNVDKTPNASEVTNPTQKDIEFTKPSTQSIIIKSSELGLTSDSAKILVVLPPKDSKAKRKLRIPDSAQKSIKHRIDLAKFGKTSQNSKDRWLSREYKENNRKFNALLNELKEGKIQSFFDKNYDIIKVSLKEERVVFDCTHESCQFTSDTINSARRHAQRHNKSKEFVCHLCKKGFALKAYLSQHLQIVHNIKGKPLISCEFPGCQFRALTPSQVKTHYIKHSEEKTVKCEHNGCDSYFKSINLMRAHMKIHSTVRQFACEWPGCEARFKTKEYLKKHSNVHTGEGTSASKLKDVLHTGNFVSNVDQNNNMFSVIRQQIINPTNGKVEVGPQLGFKCNHTGCQFATIFKHLMKQHVSTHLFGRTFECNLCDKKFGLSKYLTQHKNTVHNINNNPIMCCPVPNCQYKTTYSLGLRIHSLSHQTEKPFICEHNGCDKRFKTEVLLRWHKNNRHLKAKPFFCDYVGCRRAFEVREQLKRHLKCHNKAFQCHYDNCSRSYKHKGDLHKHIREKH